MSAAFETIYRDKLLEIAEDVLRENGARILRVLLTVTTIEIKIKDAITAPFTSKIGAPQGHSYNGLQFELYFEKSLRKIRRETGIINKKNLPQEMRFPDGYDNFCFRKSTERG